MTTLREIALLRNLDSYNHPHIVKWVDASYCDIWILNIYCVIKSDRLLDVINRRVERNQQLEIFLVFEYLDGDLANYINRLQDSPIPVMEIQVRFELAI